MSAFLKWFNADNSMDQVLKASLAHLWFVTIHPFDDGNGRIARAVADMVLARSESSSQSLDRAIESARTELSSVFAKARFWESLAGLPLNERHHLMLNRLQDGFEGNLTNAKWAKLAKCSSDTALRDIQYLVVRGILVRGTEGGRSTSYSLVRPR